MNEDVEVLFGFMRLIANGASNKTILFKYMVESKEDWVNKLRQTETSDEDVKIMLTHFDSYLRLAEKAFNS